MSDAEVISLRPEQRKLCSGCIHGYLGDGGVFCRFFREDIMDERIAEECGEYDAGPSAAGPQATSSNALPDRATQEEVADLELERVAVSFAEDLEGLCERYVEAGRSTLWGQIFMVKGGGSREELKDAGVWLASQIRGAANFAAEEVQSAKRPGAERFDAQGVLLPAERNGEAHATAGAPDPAQGEPRGEPNASPSGPASPEA